MSLPADEAERYRRWRWQIFSITWLAYAGFYLTRKGFSVAKVALGPGTAVGLTVPQLSAIDVSYNVAYCIGMFVFGIAGDRLGTRRIIVASMLVSAVVGAAMGFSATALAFSVLLVIQGVVQSTGWAPLTKNVGYFFARHERGLILGLWCTNYSLGGFLATNFAGTAGGWFGWPFAFWLPAATLVGVWLLFVLLQRDRPEDVGLPPVEEYHERSELPAAEQPDRGDAESPQRDDAWQIARQVLAEPIVWLMCAVYFCIKPVRYLFLFWMPLYAHEKLGTAMGGSALVSSVFELGGPLGMLLGGLISDRLLSARRVPVAVVSLVCLGTLVYFFDKLPAQAWLLSGMLLLMGAFTYAADSLVTCTSAVDFGTKRGASTAAGVINGCGSIGQILGAALPGLIPASWGWQGCFSIVAAGAVAAGIIMLPQWNAVPRDATSSGY